MSHSSSSSACSSSSDSEGAPSYSEPPLKEGVLSPSLAQVEGAPSTSPAEVEASASTSKAKLKSARLAPVQPSTPPPLARDTMQESPLEPTTKPAMQGRLPGVACQQCGKLVVLNQFARHRKRCGNKGRKRVVMPPAPFPRTRISAKTSPAALSARTFTHRKPAPLRAEWCNVCGRWLNGSQMARHKRNKLHMATLAKLIPAETAPAEGSPSATAPRQSSVSHG